MENDHINNCEQERNTKYEMNSMGFCGELGRKATF